MIKVEHKPTPNFVRGHMNITHIHVRKCMLFLTEQNLSQLSVLVRRYTASKCYHGKRCITHRYVTLAIWMPTSEMHTSSSPQSIRSMTYMENAIRPLPLTLSVARKLRDLICSQHDFTCVHAVPSHRQSPVSSGAQPGCHLALTTTTPLDTPVLSTA